MAPPTKDGEFPGQTVFHDDEWWSWINDRWTNGAVQPDTVILPQDPP